MFPIHHFTWVMARLAGDMKGFVVLGVYRSTVKKQNKESMIMSQVFNAYLFDSK